ncbi:FadR/GntR family transcriptional regulator [Bacillus pinisoli]|uniref:FadR/GntR family transcriptional regulator n=1 Tax=Bacillus pinisoli TaxID=2901866 RepID=UPI001FF51B85|nr:GntR family transcriptional regulator [Bacillus pinisoli]
MKKNYGIQSVPRMSEEVTRQLIQYIAAEKLKPGSKLPTERQLSERLEVSRSSVREGIRALEILQYLESRQGEGTFVSKPPPYLIPLSIIRKEENLVELHKYYQVSLLHARQILSLGISNQISIDQLQVDQADFWSSFSSLVDFVGKQLLNNYYLEIWQLTNQLLESFDFYLHVTNRFEIDKILEAYNSLNYTALTDYIQQIEEAKIV